jgi:hypothetical protein
MEKIFEPESRFYLWEDSWIPTYWESSTGDIKIPLFNVQDISDKIGYRDKFQVKRLIKIGKISKSVEDGRTYSDLIGLLEAIFRCRRKDIEGKDKSLLIRESLRVLHSKLHKHLSSICYIPFECNMTNRLYSENVVPIKRYSVCITDGKSLEIYINYCGEVIFNIRNISKIIGCNSNKVIDILGDNKVKLIKVDDSYGDKFSWFSDKCGILKILFRNRFKSPDKSRNLINLIINILFDKENGKINGI